MAPANALVSLLGSLSKTGDTVTLEAISSRLGISVQEARSMMDIVCAASGEDTAGLLISANDDGTEFTLRYPGVHGRAIRLTPSETVAVIRALDEVGLAEDDPLRAQLQDAFVSKEVRIAEVRKMLGTSHAQANVQMCARSLVEHRVLHCSYLGLRDEKPRDRHMVIRHLQPFEGFWHARAYDLVIGEERVFRTDRMSGISLGDTVVIPSESENTVRLVPCVFSSTKYYRAFPWPGLQVLHEENERITGMIAYYGPHSTWLLRRICACEGTFYVEDKRIMDAAREYARSQLK